MRDVVAENKPEKKLGRSGPACCYLYKFTAESIPEYQSKTYPFTHEAICTISASHQINSGHTNVRHIQEANPDPQSQVIRAVQDPREYTFASRRDNVY